MKQPDKLSRAQVAHHLKLALEGDPANLRHKVDLLYRAVRPKRVLHKTEYNQVDKYTITITLDRRRAKTVEELFFEFIDRCHIEGEWSVKSLKPLRISPSLFRFTFARAKEVIQIHTNGVSKKGKNYSSKKKLSIEADFDSMNDEEQEALLARLLARQAQA